MKPIYGPAHRDIDIALQAMGIEDARQREALRQFYQRDRAPLTVTEKHMLWVALGAIAVIGLAVGFGWAWVFPIGQ